jgi:hypothetical protein
MAKINIVRKTVALLLIGIAIFLYLSDRRSRERLSGSSNLLADTGGTLSLVVCNVNSANRAILRNTALVNNIINKLGKSTRVVLVVNDPNSFTVAANPWPDRIKFLTLPSAISMTIWPQDPFVVLQDSDGQNQLLLSRIFERGNDREMAIELAKYLGWKWKDSKLSFDGGNIVADKKHIFIGANTIYDNAAKLKEKPEEIVLRFERELGREVLVIGPVPQPIGHIDMMLTPLGENKIILADPNWGAKLAADQLSNSPEKVKAFELNCEKMFFANLEIQQLRDIKGNIIEAPPIVGLTKQAIEDSRKIAPQLDRLAETLSNRGYEIIRMPFLFTLAEYVDSNSADVDPNQHKAGYPQITYNNVLLDVVENRQVVYLPQYGWPALDNAARKAWEKTGYEVVAIGDFSTSAMYGGALRCCVKVLQRK